MAEAVNPEKIIESVSVANLKAIAEVPAVQQNLATANAVAHQQAMWAIEKAAVGKIIESIISTSPAEGGGDVAALGQLMKGLQLTPPPSE